MTNRHETQYGPTILIVDDEPANLAVLTNYLANSGFQIQVARTGESGVDIARLSPPDLILLDVLLPGIDGFEACRRLKADERTQAIPVLFMTILTKVDDKLHGFAAGGMDYITKPFQRQEVLARVSIHLTNSQLRRDLQALNVGLGQQVATRTAELHAANAQLQVELAERKQAEAEVRRLNQELEQRVLQRTAQLEAANKELESFAYSVSHDLRAPLRHIDGFIGLLQRHNPSALDDQSQRYVKTIADAATRMGQLIDDLLAFSRMGRTEMSTRPVALADLVREAIEELRPETEDREIHWRIADLPVVSGDRAMLRLVLVNLIGNAVKFTRSRESADIEIGCQSDLDTDVAIFVRDNGVGFDMAYADKLFGVFQRLHRAEDFEGTGIGLATVRRIIARHGGRTWAEGQLNQGATFYFSLLQELQPRRDA
jgi:signal transduction histidine kinase